MFHKKAAGFCGKTGLAFEKSRSIWYNYPIFGMIRGKYVSRGTKGCERCQNAPGLL